MQKKKKTQAPFPLHIYIYTITQMGKDYPDVELTHMYVDNAAMQLVRNPKYFDVIVTGKQP